MKFKFYFILFFLSALKMPGQVTLEVTEVKESRVNQRFNLTIMLQISGENMQQETPLRLPDLSKFDIIGSASEQNTVVLDARKNEVINQMVYQFVLSPKQAGKIKIGSVLVTVNGKIYKTEPFDMFVRDGEKTVAPSDLAVDESVYLNMEIRDRSVYKNQPTVAVLRAYSRDFGSFRKVRNIEFPQQKNVRIQPVSMRKSEIESRSGLASQVLAIFLVFPSETGSIEINPASASILRNRKEKITSNSVRLNVKKLPAGMPANFKNAVGNFDVSLVKNDPAMVPEVDQPLNVKVKLTGEGNLNTVRMPKLLPSENYVFFKPTITSNTRASDEKLSGTITADYVVIPKKPGPINVLLENFSFFNPADEKYVDFGAQTLALYVMTHQQILDSKTTLEKVNDYTNNVLETVNTPVLQTQNLKVKNPKSIDWKIVFVNLGILVAALSLFVVFRRRFYQRKPVLVENYKPITTVSETEAALKNNLEYSFDDSIEYLKFLAINNDSVKFFETYDELNFRLMQRYERANNDDFRKLLSERFGQGIAEEYRLISEKIKIEKYSPVQMQESLIKLSDDIAALFKKITS